MTSRLNIFSILILAILSFFVFKNNSVDKSFDLLLNRIKSQKKENPLKRAKYEFNMLVNPTTGDIPKDIRRDEIKFVKNIQVVNKKALSKISNAHAINFQSRGPVNRGGRVRALGVDVRSTASNSVIIAAGVSGGIWRSTDNGTSWTQTSLPSQINNATCMVQDKRIGHRDTWYVGTGEAFGNSASGDGGSTYRGNGIFKSTDNGLSWSLLTNTSSNTPQKFDSGFDFIHNIAVNPISGKIYVATCNTITSSNDEGITWKLELSSLRNTSFSDVISSSTGTIYAAINSSVPKSGIWKSDDDGNTWSDITPTNFPSVYNRIVIAVAPSNENKLYILAHTPDSGKDDHSFWASNDKGNSWINYSNNLPNSEGEVGGYTSQDGYDMVIAVKPDDPNFVLFGGTNLHRSTNGMTSKLLNTSANWIGGYSVTNDISTYANHHPDQHALVFAPYNSNIVYSSNDGGVQVTSNILKSFVRWKDINTGFITSQFYSIAMDNATADDPILLGGLQDNGNWFTNSTNASAPWVEMIAGGDGGITAIANGKSHYYIETQNGDVIRLQLTTSGDLFNFASVKPNYDTYYLFVNPYILDPNNSNIMYFVAGDSLWRNSDLTAIPNWGEDPTNINWTALSNTRTGDYITSVVASKTPANIVYYGTSDGQIFRLDNANVGNPIPVNISNGKGMPNGYISSLAVNPNNADNLLAVFSNYGIISLYFTSDGGTTWSAVAGNLEENPDGSGSGPSCRWASISNFGEKTTYFVATSAGLYSTNVLNGMSTKWTQESPDKIGVAVCSMVKTREIDGTIVVATHGSGIYSGKLKSNKSEIVILTENFDSETFPPTGWTQKITTADKTWIKKNDNEHPFTQIDQTNIYSAFCPWKSADQNEILYSPTLVLPKGDISLNFYAGYNSTWLHKATLKLAISTNGGNNWTPLWEANKDQYTWKWREVAIDLTNYSNKTILLAWQYIGNEGDNIAIDNIKINGIVVGVNECSTFPTDFKLSQNYPNPFNPTTTIQYSISKSGVASLNIYNIRGEIVSEIVNKNHSAGNYSVTFDASKLASGTYIYQLTSGRNSLAKKMLLIK